MISVEQTEIPAERTDGLAHRHIDGIPVRNIWLLLLYASELFRSIQKEQRAAVEENPDNIADLVAEILTGAVRRRLRRNLSFGFESRSADLNRVRGRINLLQTERRGLLQRGKVACSFEELTVDTPRNRFVKMALFEIGKFVGSPELARRCRAAAASLERAGVSGDPSFDRRRIMTGIDLGNWGRINFDDRQILAAARLAFNLALPTEDPGDSHLPQPDRDSHWVRRLFERALGGFYDVVLPEEVWKVSRGSQIHWQVYSATPGLHDILPSMYTDIVLERSDQSNPGMGRRIVMDTKFTEIVQQGWKRDKTLRSGYIYQIYAYLRSQEREADPLSKHSTGMLLHPAVGRKIDEAAVIQGHEIRFVTVDLAASSREIRDRLLEIVCGSPLGDS